MLDARLRPLIDPPLNRLGHWLARWGISANLVTAAGIVLAVAAGIALAGGHTGAGLVLVIANRLLDGLDGAVARATRLSDFGGYLDIVGDFVFYLAVPLGFGLAAPANLIPALVLASCFGLTGISFLAFAAIAAKRGLETNAHGRKSFFYNTGLAEGTETIIVFILFCLWPAHFPAIAFIYAGLCIVTVIQRTAAAWAAFKL
ncbi:CDP-alcohol phosphatidyltransferase family protein [Sandarakinorhabdus limnophila]|uniref:CDP-alcohol phosphatidyltransferase family protein n=1 Tax=Sandarakinorhabdus limnophila TaxID=210512 RepID=UPI0026EF40EA|nr:CDP-alcohol phosphatidyltransferase family protein [Sandarakinorhabdus limnophila]